MRAVVQRTRCSSVKVDEIVVGNAGAGLTVLLGVGKNDTSADVEWLAEKILNLRIFEDEVGKMNNSLLDFGGELLVISQFTLYADCRKGRRPGFDNAGRPELAEVLYEEFIAYCRERGVVCGTGCFQTEMVVSLENSGPVTILLDSEKLF